MLGDEHSRRQFIKNGLLSLIALPIARRAQISRSQQVIVQLEGRANDLREEIVSFGLPLPFGFLNDPREVRVLAEDGTELVAAVRSLEPWRTGGREGSIRSVLIQFKADFSARTTQRVTVRFGRRARRTEATVVAVAKTLIDESGLRGPRVQALLPADWMCAASTARPTKPKMTIARMATKTTMRPCWLRREGQGRRAERASMGVGSGMEVAKPIPRHGRATEFQERRRKGPDRLLRARGKRTLSGPVRRASPP